MAEHIRIGDVAPRVQYAADGVQTAFTYPFPIFEAGDIELRLDGVPNGNFTVLGAGQSEGGSIVLGSAPAAGTLVTLRRRLTVERITDFQSNGVLRARTLNDELDFQTAALQEVQDDIGNALRLDPAEVGGRVTLPLRAARANRLLGFDGSGDVAVFDRGDGLLGVAYPGGVPRTVEDKMAERLTARDFGAVGDGATDDWPALQAAMNAAGASGKLLEIGEGTFRVTQPLGLPTAAAGLVMLGSILYAGPDGRAALIIGDGGTSRGRQKVYMGLRVLRNAQADWSSEADIGILLRNLDGCRIEILQVEKFTIGARTLGDATGMQECTFFLGRFVDNRIGLDIHTGTASGWNNSHRYYGGQFAVTSTTRDWVIDRFGVRLSAEAGAYVAHNRHIFDGPSFSLQARDKPFAGIPFLSDVTSRGLIARDIRMEACSAYVARHTGGAQDHLYEIAWASQGYLLDIDYTATATRVGSVVRSLHQAGGHREAVRELASVPSLRAAAIRWSATEYGFEKLACLSTSPAGSPTTLAGLAYPALDAYGLSDRGVVLTGGRGLGFVVDARNCREFALAVDADSPRLVVQCFDAGMNLLTSGNLVRLSGQSVAYAAGPRWWQASADMTDAGLTRLQTVRLDAGVAYAIIGLARIDTDYEVRAMRLACDPAFSPAVLYGLPGLPLGRREIVVESAYTPPAIAGGANVQTEIAVTGARVGDFVQVGYSQNNSAIVLLGQVSRNNYVMVTLWNRAGGSITLDAGTLRLRVQKA
ncbi:phage tail fiber protein [Roseomonas sp. NAR14]|uniref:Phage tail fiber protein n=1 Tax=Roseomonas acroporae TaxID=2937791 RepID=A0A9X2BT74_9PROT|nr:glycosyl hydrolase family 28-related protein [Roseomonas acroporae]MCK8784333.1 phage tail fiber protein [Roseomonas acroporae]